MLTFTLSRQENTDSYCMGRLFVAAANEQPRFICDTLEPPSRPFSPSVKGKTAVPAGIYSLDLTHSPKFGRQLPILVNVPGMSGVRIHRGNVPADTAGCILPGKYVANGRLTLSTISEIEIVNILRQDSEAIISISDDFLAPEVVDNEPLRPFATTVPLLRFFPPALLKRLAA